MKNLKNKWNLYGNGMRTDLMNQYYFSFPIHNKPRRDINNTANYGKLNLAFDDPEIAFRSKYTSELFRAYLVYQVCSFNVIVKNNEIIVKSIRKVLGNNLFQKLMKVTIFGHFIGSEDRTGLKPLSVKLRKYGVEAIYDYAVEEELSEDEAKIREINGSKLEVKDKHEDKENVKAFGGDLKQYNEWSDIAARKKNVVRARNYFYESEQACDKNVESILESIQAAAENAGKHNFTAVKMTALGRPQLLLVLSEIIMRARAFVAQLSGKQVSIIQQNFTKEQLEEKLKESKITDVQLFLKNVESDKNGIINLFPWHGIINEDRELNESFRMPSLKQGKMVRLLSKLSENEEIMFRNMLKRLKKVIDEAEKKNVYVMMDAEHSYFQPAISRITLEMMTRYNKPGPVLFNTYQSYLKSAFNEYIADVEQSERKNFCFGFKLVRGAYMEHERERAQTFNYEDPINPNFEATTIMMHNIILETTKRMRKHLDKNELKNLIMLIGTHNEDTIRFSIEQMKENRINPGEGILHFAQLFGMSDYVTFSLGQAGYLAKKYIPYGPVDKVLPYLSRRIRENKSVLKKLKKEKIMVLREIFRRTKTRQLFHKP